MNVIGVKGFTVGVKWLLGHPVHMYCVILCSTKKFCELQILRSVCGKGKRLL